MSVTSAVWLKSGTESDSSYLASAVAERNPAVAGMTSTQEKRTTTKQYLKDGSDGHLAEWKGTPFKYISQRGKHFRVRLYVKGKEITRVFCNLVDAQDFVTSSGFDLTEKPLKRRQHDSHGREGVA